MTPLMTPGEFLIELWGRKPPGSILIWRLADRRSRWLRSLKTIPVEPREPDVYTGVGAASKSYGPTRRCPRDEIIAIAGLWADIDVQGIGAASRVNAHTSWDAAEQTAYTLAEPTILVYSGYGLQAWWLFEGGPWRFATRGDQRQAMRIAAQWQALLRSRIDHPLDYTHDLSRVLRLPGTTNMKRVWIAAPVEVWDTGPRHERDDLFEIAAQAGDVDPGYTIASGARKRVELRPARQYDDRPAEWLLGRSPRFAEIWQNRRSDLPSMSERDLALGAIAALAGADDQQIADVITAHRFAHGDAKGKGQRLDYLQRTIAKLRSEATT